MAYHVCSTVYRPSRLWIGHIGSARHQPRHSTSPSAWVSLFLPITISRRGSDPLSGSIDWANKFDWSLSSCSYIFNNWVCTFWWTEWCSGLILTLTNNIIFYLPFAKVLSQSVYRVSSSMIHASHFVCLQITQIFVGFIKAQQIIQ